MKLLVAGGTGFIGSALCRALVQHGHELCLLTRQSSRPLSRLGMRALPWEPASVWQREIAQLDGVINLAGEPIAASRWSPARRRLIEDSRVQSTRRLVEAMASAARKPAVLVNASAVGYYGPRGDEELREHDPPGSGFLAETCAAWETEASRAEALGIRVVRLRIGLVLGPDGGALPKLVPPFRFFVGGPIGSGRQWISWIHREDVVGLIAWVLAHSELSGAVNATAPAPVTMRAFCRELGRILRRPSWVPAPAGALRLLLGEMAELLLTGQRVLPDAATRAGFAFRFPEVGRALETCL